MKICIFRDDLTDISAEKEALMPTPHTYLLIMYLSTPQLAALWAFSTCLIR